MHSSVYFVFIKHIIMSLKSNGHFVYDMEYLKIMPIQCCYNDFLSFKEVEGICGGSDICLILRKHINFCHYFVINKYTGITN